MHRYSPSASHLRAGCASLFSAASSGRAWFLDTDDFGAHIAENHGTKRSWRKTGKIENGDSSEWSWHAVLLFFCLVSDKDSQIPQRRGEINDEQRTSNE